MSKNTLNLILESLFNLLAFFNYFRNYFSFSSFKVSLLLYFGLVSVLIGSINILIYYIFIGTNSYKKYSRKQNNNKLIIKNN